MISETMQEDSPGRQWSVAENAINFKTLKVLLMFFWGCENLKESVLFVIFCGYL